MVLYEDATLSALLDRPQTPLAGALAGGRDHWGHQAILRPAVAWARHYQRAAVGLDALVALAAATAAVLVRDNGRPVVSHVTYPAFMMVFPLLWVLSQAVARSYDVRCVGVGSRELRRVVRGGIGLTAAVCVTWSFAQLDLSRQAAGLTLPLATLGTLLGRAALHRVLYRIRRTGRACNRVLVVGDSADVSDLVTSVRREPHAGFVPVGACLTDLPNHLRLGGASLPVVGSPADVLAAARSVNADTVTICGDRGISRDGLRALAWSLHGTGLGLVVAPALTNVAGPRISLRPIAGLPLLHVEEPVLRGTGQMVKTTFDKVLSALGLLLFAVPLVVLAAAVKRGSPGPVFFRQSRIGLDGRSFRVWKLRTMYVDAEERLSDLLADNESDGLHFKMRHDPRITSIGRWLRRFSLDEVPQLLNVLLGDMSLIGPRPLATKDEDYRGLVRRRLLVRPGITGLGQLSSRAPLSWQESVRLDLYYVDNWSLMFDVIILWKTLFVVVRGDSGRGAPTAP